nr:hypothetical protein [Tanacetum cinerariifolium]
MVRDTIQLENSVSTISQEYLLEFSSEYGIPESLHPELSGPEEPIVEFPEGKVGVYTKFFEFANFHEKIFLTVMEWRTNAPKDEMPSAGLSRRYFLGDDVYLTFLYDDDRGMDLFSFISAPNPAKVKTETRTRAAHEVPLLTATASRVIDMEDTTVASGSLGTPFAVEKSPLDFADEDPSQVITERGEEATTEVIPESSLEKEVAAMKPVSTRGEKSIILMGLDAGSAFSMPTAQDVPAERSRSTVLYGTATAPQARHFLIFQGNGHRGPHRASCYHEGAGWYLRGEFEVREIDPLSTRRRVTQRYLSARVGRDQQLPPRHPRRESGHGSPRSTTRVAMGSQLRLRFEQEVMLLKKATTKIAKRDQRIKAREEEIKKLDQEIKSLRTVETEMHGLRNQAKNLETLLKAEVDMKKTTKAKNPGLAKELESLRAQFVDLQVSNNQLSQQVSTLRAHVTGDERIKSAFKEFKKYEDDRVNSRVAKVMSEGLKHEIECGKANLDIATIEAYDPKADAKYVGPSCSEGFEWIRKLRHSSSQLNIHVYPAVRDPKDPWSFKEEILLEDSIAANISRAEKKKKFRVVCRTHGVGSAHHARSEGVPVSMPTVAPQGLAILLSDAATQTEISEDKASPRLLRSKSLPPMYNLDWP